MVRSTFLVILLSLLPLTTLAGGKDATPLSTYSNQWNTARYLAANTAAKAGYMNEEEKTTIYILNLARMNPRLFCETVVIPYCANGFADTSSEKYYKSLISRLMSMKPLLLLNPDSVCFASASCHAVTSGKKGYVGHQRQSAMCTKLKKFHGECCSYGQPNPLAVIVSLLVDEGIENLGHREICLGEYTKIGVAKSPHKQYGSNTVIDVLY